MAMRYQYNSENDKLNTHQSVVKQRIKDSYGVGIPGQ